MGFFHVKWWGPKCSVYPSKPRKTNFLAGYPGNSGRPWSSRTRRLCSIFALVSESLYSAWKWVGTRGYFSAFPGRVSRSRRQTKPLGSWFLVTGCDKAEISTGNPFHWRSGRDSGVQCMTTSVSTSTGKAIRCRCRGLSVNRCIPKMGIFWPHRIPESLLGRPSMKAFFGHPREPLSGYKCLSVSCQWLISGLFVAYSWLMVAWSSKLWSSFAGQTPPRQPPPNH